MNKVSVVKIDFSAYPEEIPFDPSIQYLEIGQDYISSEENLVYDAVRQSLKHLGLDEDNYGTKNGSPFRDFIKPGYKVVIKPNLVTDAPNQDAITTHGSVIRPIIDYVWKALEGKGEICVCDAPEVGANFYEIVTQNGLDELIHRLRTRGINVFLEDLRARKVIKKNEVWVDEFEDPVKAKQAVVVDLKEQSFFHDTNVNLKRIGEGSYGRNQIVIHHRQGSHTYRISKYILDADVVISVPKLKTHKKAGLTCCLKNLVGINVDKDYLPHFTFGPANLGGDEFPRIAVWRIPILQIFKFLRLVLLGYFRKYTARTISSIAGIMNKIHFKMENQSPTRHVDPAEKIYHLITGTDYAGAWQGNETIWRMILDLNRIFLYSDRYGNLHHSKQRKVFYIVDGFIAGVRNAPMTPHVIKPGVVFVGNNSAMVDLAIIKLSGINPNSIPLYRETFTKQNVWLHENQSVNIILNGKELDINHIDPIMQLKEPQYWDFHGN